MEIIELSVSDISVTAVDGGSVSPVEEAGAKETVAVNAGIVALATGTAAAGVHSPLSNVVAAATSPSS